MIFRPLELSGAFEILLEPIEDNRGLFARAYCEKEFLEHGLNAAWLQMNFSITLTAGTLRGLHFQKTPYAEIKLVRCHRGKIHDVLLDLRQDSLTYGKHISIVLDADTRNAVYIPEGLAHGFQAMKDNCELHYLHSSFHAPEAEGGVNALDPELDIDWPLPIIERSDRDYNLPTFSETLSL